MAYASACDVAGNCQNILGSRDNFTTSTCPTITQVNGWLSSGCAIIETHMTANLHGVPVASTVQVYNWVKDLNALYATARVELSRTNVTLMPGERTRGQVFLEMFWDNLSEFVAMNLTDVGVGRTSVAQIYVGGISQANKDTYDGDTDRVPPRFRRGQFEFPGTVRADTTTAS